MGERVESVAAKIVRAGYRALCLKNHPDHGGSHEAMISLNAGKEYLDNLLTKPGKASVGGLDDIFDTIFPGGRNPFRTKPHSNPYGSWESAERERRAREEEVFRRAQANQREWEARIKKEEAKRKAEEERRRVRVLGEWTEVEDAYAANYTARKICCQIPGLSKPVWINLREVAPDSIVRKVGDRGTLKIRTSVARTVGIIS